MTTAASTDFGLDPQTRSFYQLTIAALQKADAPFLVGGAYAMAHYTGITRHTRDLDVFVRPQDARRVLETLERAVGCTSELTFPWFGLLQHLAKPSSRRGIASAHSAESPSNEFS